MSASDLNLAGPIRSAIIADAGISGQLALWEGEPAVFTRRPVPSDAAYPCVVVSPDAALSDADWLIARKPVVVRDVTVYGQKGAPGARSDKTRIVEDVGYRLRALFHRQRFAITVPGHRVLEIQASGPHEAPVEDDKLAARAVSLTVQLQEVP